MKFWPNAFIAIMLFFLTGAICMVWVATHNPPELVERKDAWK